MDCTDEKYYEKSTRAQRMIHFEPIFSQDGFKLKKPLYFSQWVPYRSE